MHFVSVHYLYGILFFTVLYQRRKLIEQLTQIFCYDLFPYKCILIRAGFYFRSVDENGFS